GLTRYGLHAETVRILMGMYEASLEFDLRRLPELFCGFHRRPDSTGPTLYPVACAPQAWAARSVYLLLQARLGIQIRAPERKVSFAAPLLPPNLEDTRMEPLQVGEAGAYLIFPRHGRDLWVGAAGRRRDIEM